MNTSGILKYQDTDTWQIKINPMTLSLGICIHPTVQIPFLSWVSTAHKLNLIITLNSLSTSSLLSIVIQVLYSLYYPDPEETSWHAKGEAVGINAVETMLAVNQETNVFVPTLRYTTVGTWANKLLLLWTLFSPCKTRWCDKLNGFQTWFHRIMWETYTKYCHTQVHCRTIKGTWRGTPWRLYVIKAVLLNLRYSQGWWPR